MSMIKTALKMNIVLFTLLLIVSMPLVYADWSDLTVTVDTGVVTYEEIAFIQQYRGLYYIDYVGEKPYIRTDENILYNQYMVTHFVYVDSFNSEYEIIDNVYYLYPLGDGGSPYMRFIYDVDSDDYYIIVDGDITWIDVVGRRNSSRETILTKRYRGPEHIIAHDYEQIELFITLRADIELPSFSLYIYKSDNRLEINRLAQTYTYERSDYTRIGAIILDSYNNFVYSLLNPLDIITGWLKDLGNFVWSTIKRIIDPEGIFFK